MTKEKAIDILENGYENEDELFEAFEFAIKAIKLLGCGCGLCLAHNHMKCPQFNKGNTDCYINKESWKKLVSNWQEVIEQEAKP